MITFQTRLFNAKIKDFEMGWQVAEDSPIFTSKEGEDISEVFYELHAHEPEHNNWFALLVVKKDGKIVEEDLFDSSVIDLD